MLDLLFKKLHLKKMLDHSPKKVLGQNSPPIYLSKSLEKNLRILRETLGQSSDVIIREMNIGTNSNIDAAVIYIDGLVDRNLVNHDILQPLCLTCNLSRTMLAKTTLA